MPKSAEEMTFSNKELQRQVKEKKHEEENEEEKE
jgi:hypothetical protein